jgi:hypothetical protein
MERTLRIWVDGAGDLHWTSEGLAPIEIMGILAMVQHHTMADLRRAEDKKAGEVALLDALAATRQVVN